MTAAGAGLAVVAAVAAAADSDGRNSQAALLEQAEARLRAIYDRGEFRAAPFRAEWMADSSGYIVSEPVSESEQPVRVLYRVTDGRRTVLDPQAEPDPGRPRHLSPDGRRTIEFDDGNLWVREFEGDTRKQLTDNAVPGAVWNGRAVWSPDGARIAFVETDSSRVRLRSYLVPGDPSYPEVAETRFARVGGTIPSLRVGVVAAEGGEIRWLDLPASPDGFYLGQVEWAGNSDELLIETMSRFRDEHEFLLADVRTGAIRRIYHESDPAWTVASYHKNAGLQWIRGGRAFVVLSEKDGWRHAYLYSREGELVEMLTPGEFDIIERAHIDETRNWFYYYASPDDATRKYLYRSSLDGSTKPERVTPGDQPGTHDYDFSPDGQWAFHTYSRFDTPPVTELIHLPDHRFVRTLEDNAPLRERAERAIHQPTEFLQLDIGGGVTLDAWMIRPRNFDPSRMYPILVYVYGEPHAQTVLDAWGRVHAHYHRVIADLGYLVVSIDNRGTPAPKGAAWRRSVSGSLGPLSTEDQAAGLKELARTRPYVDLTRVGIWGWSGGGSNTLNAMFRKPDVYHVGIAVAPKPQPRLYNAWFQEIYMKTPEVNPEGYRRSAPINFAEGLAGDLLIIHGTGETNTHIQITEGLVDRLIELGKPFDYMAYPNRDHGFSEGRGTQVHLRMLMVRYLIEHLPPGPR
ncbi:MAG: DPP IV N-terminal domain-containing protein [Planctomycetota bacterium]|nr:DPP IV N-terminal domain-containing protein [Planctomycetota bacterium]